MRGKRTHHREGKGLNPRPNGWISAPLDGSDKGAAARRRIHGRARACLEGWSEGDRRRCGRGIFSPCNWRGVAEEVAQGPGPNAASQAFGRLHLFFFSRHSSINLFFLSLVAWLGVNVPLVNRTVHSEPPYALTLLGWW
jgi:hypothetical protein